jgi:hypothetical protein
VSKYVQYASSFRICKDIIQLPVLDSGLSPPSLQQLILNTVAKEVDDTTSQLTTPKDSVIESLHLGKLAEIAISNGGFLWKLLLHLVSYKETKPDATSNLQNLNAALAVMSLLGFSVNNLRNAFQTEVGLIMKLMGADSAVINMLNALGISISCSSIHRKLDVRHCLQKQKLMRLFQQNTSLFKYITVHDNVDQHMRAFKKGIPAKNQNKLVQSTLRAVTVSSQSLLMIPL